MVVGVCRVIVECCGFLPLNPADLALNGRQQVTCGLGEEFVERGLVLWPEPDLGQLSVANSRDDYLEALV